MKKHSLKLNPAEVLELSTSWQLEETARATLADASKRTYVALFTVLERYDLEDHANLPWRIKSEGDEVLIEAEVPDPKPEPEKLEGAALCAVEGHDWGHFVGGATANERARCSRCRAEQLTEEEARSSWCQDGHAWRKPREGENVTGKVCERCGQVSDEPADACKDGHDWERPAGAGRAICNRGCGAIQKLPLPKPVGGPGSKLTPAQAKRGRRKARNRAATKAATL